MLPRDLRQFSNRKVFITLAAIIAVAFFTTVATIIALSVMLVYRQGAQNYNDSRVTLERLTSALYRSSSLVREYSVAPNAGQLAAYEALAGQIVEQTGAAERAATPADFSDDAKRIRPQIEAVLAEQRAVIILAADGDSPAALARLDAGAEAAAVAQAVGLLSNIQDGDVAQLAADRTRINRLAITARDIALGTLALTLGLAVAVYWLYLKAIKSERQLDRAKDEFVSLASHQLRTPATGIKSILAMLAGGDIGPLNQRQLYFANKALESSNRGLAIIEELLNVAKADSGRLVLNPTEFDLVELVQTVVAEQEADIAAAKLRLQVNLPASPIRLRADHDKLYMAIGNVLDNARKYTPEGGLVKVEVIQKFREARIIITDTGIGIAPEEIRHIFDRFRRSGTPRANYVDGTGLGLYLVRSVLDLHHGKVKVTSHPDKGARFVLCLPFRKAHTS